MWIVEAPRRYAGAGAEKGDFIGMEIEKKWEEGGEGEIVRRTVDE